MQISLDRTSPTPLYLQVKEQLKRQIERGELPAGTRLPATRTLAQKLGVNRVTVVSAYAELEAEGLVMSHVGQGTFVLGDSAVSRQEAVTDPAPWNPAFWVYGERSASAMLREMVRLAKQPGLISFAAGTPATDLLPVNEIRQAFNAVLRRDEAEALQYDFADGYPPLRSTIARYLAQRGIHITGDQVLITCGAQQAIDLVVRTVLGAGDYILAESPTYLGALDIFQAHHIRPLAIPMDNTGPRIEMLEKLMRQYRPKLLYTIPTFHNPTGVTHSLERRRQLLNLARQFGLLIIEDSVYAELSYGEQTPPPLKTLDETGQVIYIGGFSKILVPGLRIGYLVANGALYDRLVAAKRSADIYTSGLNQRALHEYLESGALSAHLDRVRVAYRERRDAMLDSAHRHFPPGARWTTPQGGFYVWVTAPGLSATELYLSAIQYGAGFALGAVFYPDAPREDTFRLNFVAHSPDTIEEGLRRLGKAWRELLARPTMRIPAQQQSALQIL